MSEEKVTFEIERVKGGLPALLSRLNDSEGVEWEPGLALAEVGDIVRFRHNGQPGKPEYIADNPRRIAELEAALATARETAVREFAEWSRRCYAIESLPDAATRFLAEGKEPR